MTKIRLKPIAPRESGIGESYTANWSVRKIELTPDRKVFNMLASRRAVRSAELFAG